jgi:hypothetical protein
VRHLQQVLLLRSHLDVVRQNLFPCHLGELRPDVVRQFRLDAVRLDELGPPPLQRDEELPDAQCGPCPGLVQTGCCLDEPSDGEYPCPGSKRKDCFLDEEFLAVGSVLPRQLPQALKSQLEALQQVLLGLQVQRELGLQARLRLELKLLQALRSPS